MPVWNGRSGHPWASIWTGPAAARVYDFYLGGFHNFAADREMGRQAIQMWPELPEIMRSNRGFLRRAVEFLVDAGVRQFLDLGSGIPTVGNVHEIAQRLAPDTRVVYVDNDPVAVEHSPAILAGDDRTAVVQRDLRDPEAVLADPAVPALLDLSRPVAVLMVAVLHFVPDEDDPAGLVARFRDAVAAGSYLALSHATAGERADRAAEHRGLYQRTATPMTMRTRDAGRAAVRRVGAGGAGPGLPAAVAAGAARRRWTDRSGCRGWPG